jgi:hypothetical protein
MEDGVLSLEFRIWSMEFWVLKTLNPKPETVEK